MAQCGCEGCAGGHFDLGPFRLLRRREVWLGGLLRRQQREEPLWLPFLFLESL